MYSKPRLKIFPLPKRLPIRRPTMTFIMGNKSLDGLVLFADTLESGAVVKRYRQKLHAVNHSEWGVAWGVAGNAHIADKFSDKVKTIIRDSDETYDRLNTELQVEQCLKWVRKQYSSPEDDIDVIFGIFGRPLYWEKNEPFLGRPELHLYRGDSLTACLSPVKDYCVAGMDVTLAAFFLETMRNPFLRMDESIRLGVIVTAIMKKYASGVGGDTNAFVYRVGCTAWEPLLDQEIAAIEGDFPISAIEDNSTQFWAHHPKARNNDEINASELEIKKSLQPIPPARSISRKLKRGK